ncbi:hypothetical protein CAPTEDRAFT_103695 [Capitella teleta]|uniref:Uncharacterized protein n=1 Tax=Capitella teleta TaxID=283909 RepID=R7UV79_CAPTE|nr:hypothetical protein CAPTEDRAFT_103695 [Capitella teleta]|eukprot:ELU10050.1 hypothetical protein CAPTEDRAFT_103695 [Capitella teleta]
MDLACLWAIITFLVFCVLVVGLVRAIRVSNTREKYVLVTGCDSGFGYNAALSLSKKCNVIACCLTPEGCQRLQELDKSFIHVIRMDVTDVRSLEAAFDEVVNIIPHGQGLWGLVNNAGLTGALGPIDWLKENDIRQVLNVNVVGMLMSTKTFLPLLKKAKGRIVNTSSILGMVSLPYNGVYSMSKHAVESLSDSLRLELKPFGVSVLIVQPGTHNTNLVTGIDTLVKTSWRRLPDAMKEEYGRGYLDRGKNSWYTSLMYIRNPVNRVVNAYEECLFSVWPKRRTLVGMDAQAASILSFVPSFLSDLLFSNSIISAKPASVL